MEQSLVQFKSDLAQQTVLQTVELCVLQNLI